MLIGFSLMLALGFLGAFFWAVKSGQFNDKFTPAVRILLDEDEGATAVRKKINIVE